MSNLTSRLVEKASRAAEQIDEFTQDAANNLHAAAASIREGGHQGSKGVENLAESTANKIDGAGTYIENHDREHTLARSRQLVRQYPVELLAVAAGVGFLTGFAFRRLTHTCGRSAASVSGE